MNSQEKVRENRVRRMAQRQEMSVRKSRRRDPWAIDFGVYRLVDVRGNYLVCEGSLDDIEAHLTPDQE
jgi:hypothetical protein